MDATEAPEDAGKADETSLEHPARERVDRMQGQMVSRRTVLKGVGASAAVVATGGVAAAQEGEFNPASDYSPDTRIEDTVTLKEYDGAAADDPLYFVNDSGDDDSLTNYGGAVLPRPTEGEPHNPFTFRADKLEADAYSVFPRGEQYDESGDGDAETAVTALDSTHWTDDVSNSAGSMTIADSEAATGANALSVSTSGQTAGDEALATFENFSINDGVDRRRVFLVYNVNSAETGVTTEVVVGDGNGNTRSGTIPTDGTNGVVHQVAVGDLSGADLTTIENVSLRISEANADLQVVGIDVERERHIVFGEKEQLDSDDNLESVEIEEPSGSTSVKSLDSLDDALSSAQIGDLNVDVEMHLERLGTSRYDVRFTEAERYDQDWEFEILVNVELPNPFAVRWNSPKGLDTVQNPPSRYAQVRSANPSEEVTFEDVDDDSSSISWTSHTSKYGGKNTDDDVELATAVDASNYWSYNATIRVNDSERDVLMSGRSSLSGGPTGQQGGGVLGFLTSIPGMVVGALSLAGIASYFSGKLGS